MCPPLQLVSQVAVAAFAFENLNSKYLVLRVEIWQLTYLQNNNDDKCISVKLLEICRHQKHSFHMYQNMILLYIKGRLMSCW